MQDKFKNYFVVIEFISILLILLVLNIVKKDEQISVSERRKLAQMPKFTVESILEGTAFEKFEEYAVDQFFERDWFKKVKYDFSINVLKQKDSNKLFVKDNSIYKIEYPLKESYVQKSAEKIKSIYEKYLKGMNVYYSIIPDKSYYLSDDYLKIDYLKIEEIMEKSLKDLKYIDIKQSINKEDFYRTDLHWKQENILKVSNLLLESMGLKKINSNYEEKPIGNFYGIYYGQVSSNVTQDTITYLTNDIIENCVTYNYETKKQGKVYDLEKYNTSNDKYDIFLSGPTPLIVIENKNANTSKELLLFRDSFGSSIAPLMIEEYEKIVLIDLRYMNSKLLNEYIKFENQDVLFLYSGLVLNQNILK